MSALCQLVVLSCIFVGGRGLTEVLPSPQFPGSDPRILPVQRAAKSIGKRQKIRFADGHVSSITLLAKRPRLFHVETLLSADEVAVIRNAARDSEFKPSQVSGKHAHGAQMSHERSSETQFLSAAAVPGLERLLRRVADLTRLPRSWVEQSGLQILRYHNSSFYGAHHDSRALRKYTGCRASWNMHGRPLDDDGSGSECPRYITILYYLSNTFPEGETCFPLADDQGLARLSGKQLEKLALVPDFYRNASLRCIYRNKGVIFVPPRQGNSLMWYNYVLSDKQRRGNMMAELDGLSVHMAMMPGGREGNMKYAANHWLTVPWWPDDMQKPEL